MSHVSNDDLLKIARAHRDRGPFDPEASNARINEGIRKRLREVLGRDPSDDEVREARITSLDMFMDSLDDGSRQTPDQTADTLARILAAMRQAEAEVSDVSTDAAKPPAASGGSDDTG